ncbi:MAG: phenylalanine--tRNA ligase subunit alpha [bacterium]
MQDKLLKIEQEAVSAITGASSLEELEGLRIKYLGKKSEIQEALKLLPSLSDILRPKAGQLANEIKNKIKLLIDERTGNISREETTRKLKGEKIDITLPGTGMIKGKLHPITKTLEEIKQIFTRIGYSVAEGPDIETNWNNFEALNFPSEHPAMDMQATFFIEGGHVLRTHTSPVQIRVMEKTNPPLSIIMPGRVYRCDADVTHSPVFHQLEGLVVDKNISFADLKGTLTYFTRETFGAERRVRFRPSFFPFTEPSAEMDIECIICSGVGCRVCKNTGWLEILGAGMVDPNVFRNVGYDPEKYSGFAFGMGIERIAILKYGIPDIRLFYENDLRFLRQF